MPTGIGGEKLWLCPSLDDSADDISGNSNHGTYNGGMGLLLIHLMAVLVLTVSMGRMITSILEVF